MRSYYISALFVLFSFAQVVSQKNSEHGEHWELLFQNNRKEALASIQRNKANNISDHLSEQVIKVENGIFNSSEGLIKAIENDKDFEYYLYALWNYPFFFDDYLETGFNNRNSKNIGDINLQSIENSTIKEAMRYLKSIVARRNKDWETYYKLNKEIPVIKDWQYCGVFENLNGSGLDTEYTPEQFAISKEDFNANSNGYTNWYDYPAMKKESYQFYFNHSEYGGGVNYAQTFISSPQDKKAVLRLGASSFMKVWLNDVLIFENTNDGITDLDAYNIALTIPKGRNRLLIKNADKSSSGYFIARFTDDNGNPVDEFTYSSTPSPYNKSSLDVLDPVEMTNSIEAFFEKKVKNNPNDFFLKLCLINTYMRNSKYTQAKILISPLLDKYPKCSFLKTFLIASYKLEKDLSSASELEQNIQKDDKDYYLSYIYRYQESDELFKLPLPEFEKFVQDFSEATDYDILKETALLLAYIRREDIGAIKEKLDHITSNFIDNTKLIKIYNSFYSDYLNEDEKAIRVLEKITNTYLDYDATKTLASYYHKQNKKKQAMKLFEDQYENLNWDNGYLFDYVDYLHAYEEYEKSVPVLDQALKNYPFSFLAMEYMGFALEQMGEKEKALKYYSRSLKRNSSNASLRKKIDDLSKTRDYLGELATDNMYDYITEKRAINTSNSYGYDYLLQEKLVQIYREGGGKTRGIYAIKVSSNAGLEALKEINLGLSGNYLITKSEIVKPDKTLVPASKSGSNLVFDNLEIGDVIYIDYERSYSSTGRFFRDHVYYHPFDSYYPSSKKTFKLLVPSQTKFQHKLLNGEVAHTTENIDNYVYHKWEARNSQAMNPKEDYMPSASDVFRYLHISTINSWDDIALWYSDLVRPQMQINSDVEAAFRTIFPGDISKLTDEEKAERIYYYLMENFSYSHVNFKQSGFIPQKPAKTIKSKLGDCKDFSTLYTTLAKMADLKSHLVLILTSDYGENSMLLPSQDFNHCIVKVFIDGEPKYLELTDNNLPFGAIPTSLEDATALEIPDKWTRSVAKGIYKLKDLDHIMTTVSSTMDLSMGNNSHKLIVNSSYEGSLKSNYARILKEKNYKIIKDEIFEDFKNRLSEDFVLDTVYGLDFESRSPIITYTSEIRINESLDKVGGMKVFRLPKVNNAYNASIVNYEERAYPIDYLLYENADVYKSTYQVKLEKDEQFVEIPKSKKLQFKNHFFHISYELVKGNELHVSIEAKTPKDRIGIEEYKEFKIYVKSVLDAKNQLIGFRNLKAEP